MGARRDGGSLRGGHQRPRRAPPRVRAGGGLSGCQSPPDSAVSEAVALQLPASFTGAQPCPDCAGARAHLDLWPDGVFHLRRTFTDQSGHDDDLGRWRRDPGRPVILLYGGREMPLQFEIVSPRTLRARRCRRALYPRSSVFQ